MPRTRRLIALAAVTATAAFAVPAAASAGPTVAMPGPAPETHVERAPKERKAMPRKARVKRVRVSANLAGLIRAGGPQGRLLGTEGVDYVTKRDQLIGYISYFYATHVPAARGTYVQPEIYEGADGFDLGCGQVWNGGACPTLNRIGLASGYVRNLYLKGDTHLGLLIAHEFGHRAGSWLNYGTRGNFRFTLYREGFADCMAGAWYRWMQDNGWTDMAGYAGGDGQEFVALFTGLADSVTSLHGHGDAGWRNAAALYGYQAGFSGCVTWGNAIYHGRA